MFFLFLFNIHVKNITCPQSLREKILFFAFSKSQSDDMLVAPCSRRRNVGLNMFFRFMNFVGMIYIFVSSLPDSIFLRFTKSLIVKSGIQTFHTYGVYNNKSHRDDMLFVCGVNHRNEYKL